MPNTFFKFKEFAVHQDRCAMKVTTDACILGAWFAAKLRDYTYVLDLGAGTGLLTLMLAQKLRSEFQAIEIDLESFRQLKENIDHCNWKDKCKVMIGDARSYSFQVKFDFIISNPPFYENQLESPDDRVNKARHSKDMSLEDMFRIMQENLAEDGSAGILIPWSREKECLDLAKASGFHLSEVLRVRQTPAHGFFRSILHLTKFPSMPITEHELTIKDDRNEYTPEFHELLKDYYLKF